MDFKNYYLNEDQAYLIHRIGDILAGLQDLQQNIDNLGTRQLSAMSENIVNQIRRILHQHWPREDQKYLETLQKIGVAIMLAIEDNGDLKETIQSSVELLEKETGDSGKPVNDLGSPAEAKPDNKNSLAEPTE